MKNIKNKKGTGMFDLIIKTSIAFAVIVVLIYLVSIGQGLFSLMGTNALDATGDSMSVYCPVNGIIYGSVPSMDTLNMIFCSSYEGAEVYNASFAYFKSNSNYKGDHSNIGSTVDDMPDYSKGDVVCDPGEVLCGAKNSDTDLSKVEDIANIFDSGESYFPLGSIRCCPATDIFVNSFIKEVNSIEHVKFIKSKGRTEFTCPNGMVMCGAKNKRDKKSKLARIWCCKYKTGDRVPELGWIDFEHNIELTQGGDFDGDGLDEVAVYIEGQAGDGNDTIFVLDKPLDLYNKELSPSSDAPASSWEEVAKIGSPVEGVYELHTILNATPVHDVSDLASGDFTENGKDDLAILDSGDTVYIVNNTVEEPEMVITENIPIGMRSISGGNFNTTEAGDEILTLKSGEALKIFHNPIDEDGNGNIRHPNTLVYDGVHGVDNFKNLGSGQFDLYEGTDIVFYNKSDDTLNFIGNPLDSGEIDYEKTRYDIDKLVSANFNKGDDPSELIVVKSDGTVYLMGEIQSAGWSKISEFYNADVVSVSAGEFEDNNQEGYAIADSKGVIKVWSNASTSSDLFT